MPNILSGLHTPIPYVRAQFISFITICVPLLSKYLKSQSVNCLVRQEIIALFRYFKEIFGA